MLYFWCAPGRPFCPPIRLFGQNYRLNFDIFAVTHSLALTLSCIIPHKLFVSLTVRPGGAHVLQPYTYLDFLLFIHIQ